MSVADWIPMACLVGVMVCSVLTIYWCRQASKNWAAAERSWNEAERLLEAAAVGRQGMTKKPPRLLY